MKRVAKKVNNKSIKKSVFKNSENELVTRKILKEELSDFVTKKYFKTEIRKELENFVTKDTFKKEMDRIDKRFEDQTNTILGAVENLLENAVNRLEVGFEKEREEQKVFREMMLGHDNKIKNLDKRVVKLEAKVL